ncbi:hypothetical protein EK904_005850 [Melospiza melodia maxima]|nr:hypothetical protein EK904_005850 [Melospiza melodia maxima]
MHAINKTDKHLQHKASSKASWEWQFVFLVPNSGMQRLENNPIISRNQPAIFGMEQRAELRSQ